MQNNDLSHQLHILRIGVRIGEALDGETMEDTAEICAKLLCFTLDDLKCEPRARKQVVQLLNDILRAEGLELQEIA